MRRGSMAGRRAMAGPPPWAERGRGCRGGRGHGCGCHDEAQVDLDVIDEVEILEEFQRDLEQAVADIADRIKRLRRAVEA